MFSEGSSRSGSDTITFPSYAPRFLGTAIHAEVVAHEHVRELMSKARATVKTLAAEVPAAERADADALRAELLAGRPRPTGSAVADLTLRRELAAADLAALAGAEQDAGFVVLAAIDERADALAAAEQAKIETARTLVATAVEQLTAGLDALEEPARVLEYVAATVERDARGAGKALHRARTVPAPRSIVSEDPFGRTVLDPLALSRALLAHAETYAAPEVDDLEDEPVAEVVDPAPVLDGVVRVVPNGPSTDAEGRSTSRPRRTRGAVRVL